jgi:hypothetical protein
VVFVRGFIDRSETFQGPASTVSVAAWVGPVSSWSMFDLLWRECRAEAKIKKFHMTDYARRKGDYSCWSEQKRRAVVDELLTLTNSTITYGASVAVNLADYQRECPELHPYVYCASQCISVIAMRLQQRGTTERIFYVYDDGDEHSGEFREVMSDLVGLGENYRSLFNIHSIIPGAGIAWPGLDAADYFAWTGSHLPGYYYQRLRELDIGEFWRLDGDNMKLAIRVMREEKLDCFPELRRLARKYGYRREDV